MRFFPNSKAQQVDSSIKKKVFFSSTFDIFFELYLKYQILLNSSINDLLRLLYAHTSEKFQSVLFTS